MKSDLSNFIHVPQLYINILCLQHWFDQADDNIANKSIENKHKDEYRHEYYAESVDN